MVKGWKHLAFFLFLSLPFVVYGEDAVLKTFPSKETWFLPTGTILKATTQNAIFSFNLEVPVIATLDEAAVSPKTNAVVFPAGTRLIGVASVLKTDDRVNVAFHTAVLPDPSGREFGIQGLILFPDGSAGLKGIVKEYKEAKLMSSAVGGALTGVGQYVAATSDTAILGKAVGGALTSAATEAQMGMTPKVDVSVSVSPFQKCGVFLMRRVVLDDERTSK